MKYSISLAPYNLTFQAVNDKSIPMGSISISFSSEKGERIGKLMSLIRHPEFKGYGVCKDLIQIATETCFYFGCEKIYTGVYKRRSGIITLLKKLGWKEIDCESKYHRRFVLNKEMRE